MHKFFSYFLIIMVFFSCGGDTPTVNIESVITDKDWKESQHTDRFNLSSTNNVFRSKSAMCEDYIEEGNWLLEGNQLYHVINVGPIEISEDLGTIVYYTEDELHLLTPADTTILFLAVDVAVYGCTTETSPYFNPQANCDDDSCDELVGENCFDGILNNGEEFVDCGGPICPPCGPCENGVWDPLLGEQWVDCGGDCPPCDPSYNGQIDPGELGIDCGCDGCPACIELCGDGLPNGNEEGVDCGGPDCEACPTCTDDIMNGNEIGIDCGGPDCAACPTTGDCTNGLQDGDELYIDCGGSSCPPCVGQITWKANGQTFLGDVSATATLDAANIILTGVSSTGATINFELEDPGTGFTTGMPVITINSTTAPGTVGAYTSPPPALSYSTANGGNMTVDINYASPGGGGFISGVFSGNPQTVDGVQVTISQGSFALPIQ